MHIILHILLCLSFQQVLLGPFSLSAGFPDTGERSDGLEIETNISPNECLNDSVGNCGNKQYHPTYAYESDPQIITSNLPYKFDRLSDLDCLNFNKRNLSNWRAEGQETTLKQVLIIHRHGDRTPIRFPPKDNIASEPFWQLHGIGQLTNRGKCRLHMLGKIIRERYNTFLEGSVNKNFRKSRASGAFRCIESAEVFLSSFLSLDLQNSPDAQSLIWGPKNNSLARLWQPASISTLAAKFDGMLNEGSHCITMDEETDAMDSSPEAKRINEEYKREAEVLQRVLGFNMDHYYMWFWASSVIEVERSYFKSKMNPEVLEIYDRLQKASDLALGIYQSTLKSKRLRAGLLINDMINNMKNFRDLTQNVSSVDSNFVKKFVHYSAHDLNIVVLLGMLNSWDKFPTRPDYASNLLLELHQDQNEWFVKIFYMPHVPMKLHELHLEDCEQVDPKGRCPLHKFDSLMQKYKVDSWQNWMKECKNDLSQVDPYAPNN